MKGKKTGGRQKGSLNGENKAIREMILDALNEADEDGPIAYLKKQAVNNPNAFMTLIGKVIPSEVNANIRGLIKTQTEVTFVRRSIPVQG